MRRPPIWFSGTLAVGVALSISVFVLIRNWERAVLEESASNRVSEQLEKLRVSMLRSIEVLYSIRSLYSAEGQMDPNSFRAFVRQALERQPELQALSWNPVVPNGKRSKFELYSGFPIRERDRSGQLIAAGERDFFVPVSLIQPTAGNNQALGYDLSSDALRRQSLKRAQETGKAIGTAALRLAQGPKDLTGFLVLLPIFEGDELDSLPDKKIIAGFAVAVFRVPTLVSDVFQELGKHGIQVELRDISSAGQVIFSTVQGRPLRLAEKELEFAEHRWSVAYFATPKLTTGFGGLQSWAVLLVGLAFTGMTSAYLWSSWRRAAEVGKANAALQVEIVERKRAEELAANANQAKSDFLARMSHEIRTPLNAILGYTQLMQRDLHLSAEQRDSVSGIYGSGMHLLGLINEVLDLSKIEAGRMDLNVSGFDLQLVCKDMSATFRPLCAQKRINLDIVLDPGSRSRLVRGDEGKLRQVLINLVGNAVKFTVIGEVSLRVSALSEEGWCFEVIDSGLGIPEDERVNIFEPFHQGKGAQHFGGTGLGLAIAHRQVDLMGGKLEFESERGIGTRFYFSLPLPAATPTEAQALIDTTERVDPVQSSTISMISLPPDLRNRLMLAAELHSATALKACLRELRELGPESAPLAESIRNLMRSYDMNGIQRLLEQATERKEGEIHHGIGSA